MPKPDITEAINVLTELNSDELENLTLKQVRRIRELIEQIDAAAFDAEVW